MTTLFLQPETVMSGLLVQRKVKISCRKPTSCGDSSFSDGRELKGLEELKKAECFTKGSDTHFGLHFKALFFPSFISLLCYF